MQSNDLTITQEKPHSVIRGTKELMGPKAHRKILDGFPRLLNTIKQADSE